MPEDKIDVTHDDLDLDKPLVTQGGYVENRDHKPDPFHQYGTLETTDFGQNPSQQINAVSPVFEEARARNLQTAARALDPNDPTPSELVVLPSAQVTVQGSERTSEDARAELLGAVKQMQDDPVVLGVSPSAREAALGTLPEDAEGEETEADLRRAEYQEEVQATEDDRLAAQREKETVAGTPVASGGSDTAAPVAGTSATPSATPPKEDTAKSSTSTSSRSTSTASKSSASTTKSGTDKK